MRQLFAVAGLALFASCSLQGVGEGSTGGSARPASTRGGSSSGGTTSLASTSHSNTSSSSGSTSSSSAACGVDNCPSCSSPYSCQDDSCLDGTWTCGCGCLDAGTGCGDVTCPTGCNISADCTECIAQSPTAGSGTSCASSADCCTGTCISGACTEAGGSSSSSSGGSSSDGGTGGSTSSGSGGISVTLTSVGVHPAALAALSALGLTPPSLAGGYSVLLQAVTLRAGAPATTTLGSVPLTAANAAGPVVFSNVSVAGGVASLGLQASNRSHGRARHAELPVLFAGDGGRQRVRRFVRYGAEPDLLRDAGFQHPEWRGVRSARELRGDPGLRRRPPSRRRVRPLRWRLRAPLREPERSGPGRTLERPDLQQRCGQFPLLPAGYRSGAATANGPTTANGVATITGISGLATVSAADAAAGTFGSRDLGTAAGSAYLVFFAPGT